MSTSDQENRKFEANLTIHAPCDAVWKALTDADEMANWFAAKVQVEPGPGGKIVWDWDGHHHWPLRIDAWEPGTLLRTSYDSSVDNGKGGKVPLFVDFHLQGDGGSTQLRLVHHGFGPDADFDQEFDGISGGWPVELGSLRLYLEQHRGTRRQLIWSRRQITAAPDAAWQRLCGNEGLNLQGNFEPNGPFSMQPDNLPELSGKVLVYDNERHVSAVVDSLNQSWLRIWVDKYQNNTSVWLWLASYGQPAAEVQRLQAGFDQIVNQLFGAQMACGESS